MTGRLSRDSAHPRTVAEVIQAFDEYGISSEALTRRQGNRPPAQWTIRDTTDLLALLRAGHEAIQRAFPKP